MIELNSERKFIESRPPSKLERFSSQTKELGVIMKYPNKHMSTILVPVYLRSYLTQIVSVSAEEENIKARFTLYLTIPKKIKKQLFYSLISEEEQGTEKHLTEEGLLNFINNNLSLQCGDQHIDIVNPACSRTLQSFQNQYVNSEAPISLQGRCQRSGMEENSEQMEEQEQLVKQDDDEDETYNESFFVTNQSWLHGQDYVTWVIEGVFNCDYELDNTFFPCMTINSGLKIVIHDQNYQTLKIKYQFMKCLTNNNMGIKIFDFKFNQHEHKRFGIYTLNLNSISCKLEQSQTNIETLLQQEYQKIEAYKQHNQASRYDQTKLNKLHSVQKELKVAQFGFQVLSFNVPFILRYQIPIWTLCFASIMLYFANAQSLSNIFGNIILISVSQISLFSSFRMGNFKTDNPSMYQISLNICLIASLLLLIDSTDNFQNLSLQQQIEGPGPNYNAYTAFFYAAISICGVALMGNIIALLYNGLKTKRLSFNHHLERNHRLCLTWNQDIFKEFFVWGGFKKSKNTDEPQL